MASGVFDILHPGHLYFLDEAKKFGNELVVVVARDVTARRLKHVPIIGEEARRLMVSALKPVDLAVLGHEEDIYQTVEKLKPDIIVLGYDQNFNEAEIEKNCKERGVNVKVQRLKKYAVSDLNGTRKIVGKIIEAYTFQKYIEEVEKKRVKKK